MYFFLLLWLILFRFLFIGITGNNLIYIRPHNCSKSASIFCEADVFLKQPLEAGGIYTFKLAVSDQTGDITEVSARVEATSGTASIADVFVKFSPTVEASEVNMSLI